MSPQEKMLLYYFDMHTDTRGDYVVGRNDVASLLSVSVVTAAKRLHGLVENGHIVERKKPLARGLGYKWIYWITPKGQSMLKFHEKEAVELYRSHKSDKLIEALKEARRIGKKSGKAIKRHEKQLSMFGDE